MRKKKETSRQHVRMGSVESCPFFFQGGATAAAAAAADGNGFRPYVFPHRLIY